MIRAKNDNTEITESDTTQSTSSANICSVWKHFDDKVAQVKITSNPNATASIMIRQIWVFGLGTLVFGSIEDCD
ncbi:hypothetical protein QTP88_009713 [Uroleucon formosanum]